MRLVLTVLLLISAAPVWAQVASGTAFAVASELLVTNQHVVAGCSSIEIIAADGRRKASVVVADADIDLALLRASGLKGPTARLRNPRAVRLGESVMVFGYPLAGALSSGGNFTSGLVSALRGLRDTAGELQITAPVQPGNSGGPLMDASGLVIGVVQAKLDALRVMRATGDVPQNVNFAVSLEVLAEFLVKNKVRFGAGSKTAPMDTARVAEMAQGFTYRVECRGNSQQATNSPNVEPGQRPSCTGSYQPATWTNCVGTYTVPDGAKYVGEYRDGKKHGQGTYTWTNGSTYVGEYRDGKQHGQGTYTGTNGSTYVGGWRDDKLNGQGTYTWPDGKKYVGEYRDDKENGQGTHTWPNGQKYVGEFRDGKANGQGTYTWPSGRRYVGNNSDGKENGQGTLTGPNGAILHSGMWADGKPVR